MLLGKYFLSLTVLLVCRTGFAQDNYERMKYAIEHHNVGRVKQLLELETRNKDVMAAWSFKVAAAYNSQKIMQYLYTTNPPLDPTWLNTLVMGYWNEGRRAETEYWGVRALEVIERQLGKDHEEYGIALHMLGILYFRDARYEQASACLNGAYAIYLSKLGADHKKTIEMANTIAALNKEMNGRN